MAYKRRVVRRKKRYVRKAVGRRTVRGISSYSNNPYALSGLVGSYGRGSGDTPHIKPKSFQETGVVPPSAKWTADNNVKQGHYSKGTTPTKIYKMPASYKGTPEQLYWSDFNSEKNRKKRQGEIDRFNSNQFGVKYTNGIAKQPESFGWRQAARIAAGSVGRHANALGTFADMFLPAGIGSKLGAFVNRKARGIGKGFGRKYKSTSKTTNAFLSFIDGEKRKGNINEYTDLLGTGMLALAPYSDKLHRKVKNSDAWNNKFNLPDSVEGGLDSISEYLAWKKNPKQNPNYNPPGREYLSNHPDVQSFWNSMGSKRQPKSSGWTSDDIYNYDSRLKSKPLPSIPGSDKDKLHVTPYVRPRSKPLPSIPSDRRGSYKTRSGSVINRKRERIVNRRNTKPRFTYPVTHSASRSYIKASSKFNRGGMVITHREYVRDIPPSSVFTRYDYPINPGLVQITPWLSDLASAYEQYNIRAMVFEFKSTSSDTPITTNNSVGLGSVILAVNYNGFNNPFLDKRTMQNYDGAKSTKPSNSCIISLDQRKASTPISGPKWVRNGPIPLNADGRLYDPGIFSIATQGQDTLATGVVGELWVAYEIEFIKPKYNGSIGGNLLMDHYSMQYTNSGTWTTASPLGVTIPPSGKLIPNNCSALGTYISSTTPSPGLNTINFDASHQGMTFMINICHRSRGVGVTQVVGLTPSSVNLSGITGYKNDSVNWAATGGNVAGTNLTPITMNTHLVRVDYHNTGPWQMKYVFTAGNVPFDAGVAGMGDLDVYVVQINGTDPVGPLFT